MRDDKKNLKEELQSLLQLPTLPVVIESFDIANTGDKAIMAGMVRFVDGQKDKKNYRLFNIRTTRGQDDFKSMEEAIGRRYERLLKEKKSLPDLLVIDGGKGQLSSALKGLARLGLDSFSVISIAKKKETIFVPKLKEGINLPLTHPVLRFLVSIRDETHRFINTRHIKKRTQQDLSSRLLGLKKIGPQKIKSLLKQFTSFSEIKSMDKKKLRELSLLSEKDVEVLLDFLKKEDVKL